MDDGAAAARAVGGDGRIDRAAEALAFERARQHVPLPGAGRRDREMLRRAAAAAAEGGAERLDAVRRRIEDRGEDALAARRGALARQGERHEDGASGRAGHALTLGGEMIDQQGGGHFSPRRGGAGPRACRPPPA